MIEQPDGIIITIGSDMIKEKGYRNWLRNFLTAMASETTTYWMRQGSQPTKEVMYVYLCIGGRVRFRANFVMSYGAGNKVFDDGRQMYGKAWIVLSGPIARPKQGERIELKGFRGFRYCEKLF